MGPSSDGGFDPDAMAELRETLSCNACKSVFDIWADMCEAGDVPCRKAFTLPMIGRLCPDIFFILHERTTDRWKVMNTGDEVTELHKRNYIGKYVDEVAEKAVVDHWRQNFPFCLEGRPYVSHYDIEFSEFHKVPTESVNLPVRSKPGGRINMIFGAYKRTSPTF